MRVAMSASKTVVFPTVSKPPVAVMIRRVANSVLRAIVINRCWRSLQLGFAVPALSVKKITVYLSELLPFRGPVNRLPSLMLIKPFYRQLSRCGRHTPGCGQFRPEFRQINVPHLSSSACFPGLLEPSSVASLVVFESDSKSKFRDHSLGPSSPRQNVRKADHEAP